MTKDKLNRRCAIHEGHVHSAVVGWIHSDDGRYFDIDDYTTDQNAAARIIDMAVDKNAFRYAELLDSEAYKVRYNDTGLNHHSNQIEWRLKKALEVLDG